MEYRVDDCPGDDDRLPCWFVYKSIAGSNVSPIIEKFYGPNAEYDARLYAEALNNAPLEAGCEFD
jgi:hypothetical protein